jgi:hypothetical protein
MCSAMADSFDTIVVKKQGIEKSVHPGEEITPTSKSFQGIGTSCFMLNPSSLFIIAGLPDVMLAVQMTQCICHCDASHMQSDSYPRTN